MKIKIIPKIKVQTGGFQQRPLHYFNPSHCCFHPSLSGSQPSVSDRKPSRGFSVNAAMGSERSVSGCNRSALPTHSWLVTSVFSAKVSDAWHNGRLAAHVAFINSVMVSVIALSGCFKAVSGLIKSFVVSS